MPVYGKENVEVEKNIKKLLKKIKNITDVKLVIVFKSSEEEPKFNYDYFFDIFESELHNNLIEIYKVDFSFKRTQKIRTALISMERSKYFQVIDSHHNINKKQFIKFIKTLRKKKDLNIDYIANPVIMYDVDNKKKKVNGAHPYAWGGGYLSFNTDKVCTFFNNSKIDIVYFDDATLSTLFWLNNLDVDLIVWSHKISWYIRNFGNKISTTSKIESFDKTHLVNIANDIKQLVELNLKSLSNMKIDTTSESFKSYINIIKRLIFWYETYMNKAQEKPEKFNIPNNLKKYDW